MGTELSIIFPVKNIEKEIANILSFTVEQTKGLNTEFIVLDMGSTDRTVFQAVKLIREFGLNGVVIQNGVSAVPDTLNVGLQKSGGEYITFVFARRLYENFYKAYLETAKHSGADFVFGCFSKDEARLAERRYISKAVKRIGGNQILKDMIRHTVNIDISAILIRRGFLQEKQIVFHDGISYGYADEFICRCLLNSDCIAQSPVVLKRGGNIELNRGKQKPVGKDIFQRVEAVLHIIDTAKIKYGADRELTRLLKYEGMPLTVMGAVDIALKEGSSYRAVRACLRASGYDELLTFDRKTDKSLKQKILTWRIAPWLYHPK